MRKSGIEIVMDWIAWIMLTVLAFMAFGYFLMWLIEKIIKWFKPIWEAA